MNLSLWIVAGLLAVVYLVSGTGKLIVPKEKLATARVHNRLQLDLCFYQASL